jgi:hypothetical protein
VCESQIARSTIEVKREQIEEVKCAALGKQGHLLATVEALTSEATKLRERNSTEFRELLVEAECPICFDRPADTVLLPCGHVCCCHTDCLSSEMQSCPVCSGAITGRTKLYGAIKLLGEMMMQAAAGRAHPQQELQRLQEEHAADVEQQLQGMQSRIRTTIKEKNEELEKIVLRHDQEAHAMKGQLKDNEALLAREQEHRQALAATMRATEQQVAAQSARMAVERATWQKRLAVKEEEREKMLDMRAQLVAMQSELEGLRRSYLDESRRVAEEKQVTQTQTSKMKALNPKP